MADLTITAAQVALVSGETVTRVAGAAITAGQTCYYDSAAGTAKLADNDAATTDDVEGLALCSCASGQHVVLQKNGTITLGAGAAPTEGQVYILSSTAGGICPISDLASADYLTILGAANGSNQLVMKIHITGIQKT